MNSSLDVVEIDAASNRSIDSIRDLRDKVSIAPSIGKHKVYIIDEVHMLTTEAFNALLKTLEEPPSHAVFILATTEAHKVPETIISRTQRFSFRPIATPDIVAHLITIAKAEDIAIDVDAVELLATSARGGFRDAISAFDQVSATPTRPINLTTVRQILGYADGELLATTCQAMAMGDVRLALIGVGDLLASGVQPGQLATQLADQWRLAMLAAAGANDAPTKLATALADQVGASRAAAFTTGLLEVTRSAAPREALEAAIVSLSLGPEPVMVATALPVVSKTALTTPVAPVTPEPAIAEPSSIGDAAQWPKVVMLIKQKHNSLASVMAMYPVEVDGDKVIIRSRFNFHRDLLMQSQKRTVIETAAQQVYGRPMVVLAVTDESAIKTAAVPKVDASTELISSALEILGGEVVD